MNCFIIHRHLVTKCMSAVKELALEGICCLDLYATNLFTRDEAINYIDDPSLKDLPVFICMHEVIVAQHAQQKFPI